MDTDKLRYFCAVAEAGSLRRAAEILRISSPALSKSVKLLESELGVRLFNPNGRGLVLTEHGVLLAERGRELLKNIEEVRREVEELENRPRELRIATFEVFSTYALSFLRHLDENAEESSKPLVLHEVLPGELELALADRKVDLGITYLPVPHSEIEFLKVCSIEMGVFARKGAFPGVVQNKLPFVVPVFPLQNIPSRVRGLDGWPDDAYARRVRYQVSLMESAFEICRQGRAAGYFPLFIVNEHNARVKAEYRLERRPSILKGRKCLTEVYIAQRKSDEESATVKRVARALRLTCKG